MRPPASPPSGTGAARACGSSRVLPLAAAAALLALAGGCTRQYEYQPVSMWNDARLKPMEPNPMPGARTTALRPVAGTVAQGQLRSDDPLVTGRSGGKLMTESPVPLTESVLKRGQERFQIFCAPCHGRIGDGQGMIVKRGFPHPPDYALVRLRNAPIGHFVDVITNGYGVMYSYAGSVPAVDRWAIAAYIRVLQKTRPVVTVDPYEAERERARQTGIRDPERGMRLPDAHRQQAPGEHGAAPGESHGTPPAGQGATPGGGSGH